DDRDAVRVDEVVGEVAALTEDDRVPQVRGGALQRVRSQDRRAVGGKRCGVAEVTGDEAEVVTFVEPRLLEIVRRPLRGGGARLVDQALRALRSGRARLAVGKWSHRGVELVGDLTRSVGHEV